jgi:hypothetical protein
MTTKPELPQVGKEYFHISYGSKETVYIVENIYHDHVILSWPKNEGRGVGAVTLNSFQQYHRPVPPKIYFDDIGVGQKFTWVKPRDCGPELCMRIGGPSFESINANRFAWTPLGGNRAGHTFLASNHRNEYEEVCINE